MLATNTSLSRNRTAMRSPASSSDTDVSASSRHGASSCTMRQPAVFAAHRTASKFDGASAAVASRVYRKSRRCTTHILSSGIAGTMVANGSGIQKDTVRNIILAWVLTLPVCVLLGAALFGAALFFVLRVLGVH